MLLSPIRGRGCERWLHGLSKPPLLASPPSGGEEHEPSEGGFRMRHVTRRTVLASALAAPAIARAQGDFPNRPIKLVIPWPPGASADAFLRTIADQAGKRLGQTVVPDNKP